MAYALDLPDAGEAGGVVVAHLVRLRPSALTPVQWISSAT
jgi:hypothetical protein